MRLRNTIFLLASLLIVKLQAQTVVIPDEAFKSCLIKKLPSALDIDSNLIISEAKKFTGTLNCNGYGIVDADIIEYFDSVDVINLTRNSIVSISAFPNNSVLTRILLDDNQLSTLPDLSALTNLRTLQVKRNQLNALPDLSNNKLLLQLYVESNELTELPTLDSLTRLGAINVSKNQLTSLPRLDSVTSLTELVLSNNEVSSVQSLQNLPLLTTLHVNGNNLTTLPEVGTDNKITSIDISENQFSEVPDFSIYPILQEADISNNYFTFSQLLNFKFIEENNTVFKNTSQYVIEVGEYTSVRKLLEQQIATGVDTDVDSVTYSWYYKGNLLQESLNDAIDVLTDSISLSGYYYCELTHPNFEDLRLRTDSFYVEVLPCFETNNLEVEVLNRTCINNTGSVTVSTSSTLPAGFVYELQASISGNTLTSQDGIFTHLGEEEYVLYGTVDICTEEISSLIVVEEEDCINAFITADADGVDDEFFLNQTGSAVIHDKFGNEIESLELPNSWGATSNGEIVAPGLYYIDINNGEELIKITVVH